MNKIHFKNIKIPDKPGVYFFMKGRDILYIGKATSLKDRVKSYFSKDLINTRGLAILEMVSQANRLKFQETDSVLEALILEANLIKKYQPKYNTKEKDNKSFNYVCITRDKLPKVLVIRGRGLNQREYLKVYGPFPNGQQLKEAMKIIRRIFPYFDDDSNKKNNREFYKQLGLVPSFGNRREKSSFPSWSGTAPISLVPARLNLGSGRRGPEEKKLFRDYFEQYKNNIKNLKLFFQGKKKSIIKNLKIKMSAFSKSKDFENAATVRNQIFALNHINDVALIKDDVVSTSQGYKNSSRFTPKGPYATQNSYIPASFRLEAYDVAHMGGKNMVGVMTVIENGELNKNEYRKFIIKTQSDANDTGALEEVLSRRLRHLEWGLPSLIVVDGSSAQVNVAKRILDRYKFDIKVVGVVKDESHKPKAIIGDEKIIKIYKKEILLANNESHRFAIAFHKQKRNKSFMI